MLWVLDHEKWGIVVIQGRERCERLPAFLFWFLPVYLPFTFNSSLFAGRAVLGGAIARMASLRRAAGAVLPHRRKGRKASGRRWPCSCGWSFSVPRRKLRYGHVALLGRRGFATHPQTPVPTPEPLGGTGSGSPGAVGEQVVIP